jgi:hypothetical protein
VAWFPILAFPLIRKCCSERPGAVKGAPVGAALRTLDGEDRSARIEEEGKQILDSGSISETRASETDALLMRQPWFYLRLVAYSFFRLSEGA